MKLARKIIACMMILCCVLGLTGCESFYQLFVDEDDTSSGVFSVIYNKDSDDETLAGISDVSFMKGDLRDKLKEHDLIFEVTLSFDPETENEASVNFKYRRNIENPDADDYCEIFYSYIGTYTQTDNTIRFKTEADGYNTVFYNVGSDFAGLEEFKEFSFAKDGSRGIWAYHYAPWEYEESAVILEDVVKDMPAVFEFTVDGRNIVSWKTTE